MHIRRMVWVVLLLALPGAVALSQTILARITAIAWAPDGTLLVVGRMDGSVDVVSVDGERVTTFNPAARHEIKSVAWNPVFSNQLAVSASISPIQVRDIITGSTLEITAKEYVIKIVFSPDGTRLASVGESDGLFGPDSAIEIWDPSTGGLLATYTDGFIFTDCAWNPQDPNLLLMAGFTNAGAEFALWDVDSQTVLWVIEEPYGVAHVAWAPDGTAFVTATEILTTEDGRAIVNIRNGANGAVIVRLPTQLPVVTNASWAPGRYLALSDTPNVEIWDTTALTLVDAFQVTSEFGVTSWSPDGEVLAYGAEGNTLNLAELYPSPIATPSPTAPAVSEGATPADLRRVFNNPGCETPSCWLGIEPGITTQAEVRRILAEIGVEYTVNPASYPPVGFGEENGIYNFLPSEDWPYIYTEGHYLAWVHFTDGIAGLTEIPVEIPLQQVLAEYGTPAHVMDLGGSTVFAVYPNERMAFAILSRQPGMVVSVLIGTEKTVRNFFLYEDSMTAPLTDCSALGIPCPIPTATLSPTAPAVSEEATPADLRRLLGDSGCQAACFLGIEPGVTSRIELESSLKELNVNFEVSAPGIGSDISTSSVLEYSFYSTAISSFIDEENETSIVSGQETVTGPIFIPLNNTVTLDIVLDSYGEPGGIVDTGSGYSYSVVYPAQGLAFLVLSGSNDVMRVVQVELGTEEMLIGRYLDRQAIQPCSEPRELCDILIEPEPSTYPPISVAGPD